jgi:hypothetical protein
MQTQRFYMFLMTYGTGKNLTHETLKSLGDDDALCLKSSQLGSVAFRCHFLASDFFSLGSIRLKANKRHSRVLVFSESYAVR